MTRIAEPAGLKHSSYRNARGQVRRHLIGCAANSKYHPDNLSTNRHTLRDCGVDELMRGQLRRMGSSSTGLSLRA